MNIKEFAPMAIPYNKYRYLYSPRPETTTPPEKLDTFEATGQYIVQPKLNGSNLLVFMNDAGEVRVMNRHNENKTGEIKLDFASLYQGKGWMVLNGEWMEKSKCDETGKSWNGNLVIFDILVYDGYILTGSTFKNRTILLSELYGSNEYAVSKIEGLHTKKYLYTTTIANIWRAICFEATDNSRIGAFKLLYDELVKIDMYEGLVLKKYESMLLPPFNEGSNRAWQLKCRKPTKTYNH